MSHFREQAWADPGLREALRAPLDDAAFIAIALDVAAGLGIELSEAELRSLLDAGRREWLERWL